MTVTKTGNFIGGLTADLARYGVVFAPDDGAGQGEGAEGTRVTNDGGDGAGQGGTTALTGGAEKKADDTASEGADKATADEGKGEGEGAEKKDGDKDDKAQGAPEKYEFTLPEGFEQMDTEALGAFEQMAREDNLSQEAAQRYIDAYAERVKGLMKSQADAFAAQKETWLEEARADKEIGGDKFDQTVASALRPIEAFDKDGSFKEVLETTGVGNHPAVIRFLSLIGEELGEDVPRAGGRGGGAADPNGWLKGVYNHPTSSPKS